MKNSVKKIGLTPLDDIFSTEESRSERESVVELPLSELHPFVGHPFKVTDDESMQETVGSIRQ